MSQAEVDLVNHPPHYKGATWESIDIIEKLGNQFRLGNALKYIFRHGKKEGHSAQQDIAKARWYLRREFTSDLPQCMVDFDTFFFHTTRSAQIADNFGITVRRLRLSIDHIMNACFWLSQGSVTEAKKCVEQAIGCLDRYLQPPQEGAE